MITENQNSKGKSQKFNSKFKTDLRERCYNFSLAMIKTLDDLPNKRSCMIIANQLIRSSTSIGANLIEARASSSRLEFKKFHEIALRSANETKYWLGLLRDSNMIDRENANTYLNEVTEIANMLVSGIMKLKHQ